MQDEEFGQDGQLRPIPDTFGALAKNTSIDTDTVCRAMAGDKDAFASLFLGTYRRMYCVVRRFLKHDEDIYDAMQMGYIKAWKYLRRLDPPENFVPWLYRIMENAAKDTLRQLYDDRIAQDEGEGEVAIPDTAPESDRAVDVQQALRSLDEVQVRLLTLYYYDGLNLREISQLQDVPLGTVYSRLRAARKKLLKVLEDKGIDSSVYGNGIAGTIAVLLRNALGTDILSATVAQEMLEHVTAVDPDAVRAAAGKVFAQRRNRAVLRLASMVAAVAVLFAALTAVLLFNFSRQQLPAETSNGVESTATTVATIAVASTATVAASATTPAPSTTPTGVVATTTATPPKNTATPTAAVPVFVPDYREGYANTSSRNALGNIERVYSGGLAVDFQDGWVYQSDGIKFRTDGSGQKVRFCNVQGFLNYMTVIGDWVYHLNDNGIMRVRTDGAVTQTVVPRSDGCNIEGFVVVDEKLYYFIQEVDSFGGVKWQTRVYDIVEEKDEALSLSELSLSAAFPLDGKIVSIHNEMLWMVDLATETVKTIGRNNGLLDYETMSSAYDGQIYSVLGDTVYNSGGCYVSLSEQHNGRRSIELTGEFLVEFADAATGRLAITIYDGKYPVDMRWYTPSEGLGESLPEAVWRTGRNQRYHTDGNGRVYLVADSPDDYAVLFSCNMDGSDMVEYK